MKGTANVCIYASILLVVSMLRTEEVTAQQKGPPPSFLSRFSETLRSTGTSERERIETDRHDFTQSTKTVGRGVFQIVGGYSFLCRSEGGETEHSHTAPELMLRLGITERMEFRIRYNDVWRFSETEDLSGSEDLRWSFKFRTTDQQGWIPESALEVRFTAPTGAPDWSTEQVNFGLDYIYGWRLSKFVELYGSTGFATNGLAEFAFLPEDPANEDFMLYTQSIAVGADLTEKVTAYGEFFGLFTDGFEDDDQSPVYFNIGVDYYFSNNCVVDVRVGNGLNHDADDFFCGVGGGWRF